MGSKSTKQVAKTGTCSYWPYNNCFDNCGFGGLGGFGGFGGAFGGLSSFYGGFNNFGFNGISPLALPYGGGCFGAAQGMTHGKISMKNTLTKAKFNYKW